MRIKLLTQCSAPQMRTPHDPNDGARRLKLRVHTRLLETLDVSKLDALEPAMVSAKVTRQSTIRLMKKAGC